MLSDREYAIGMGAALAALLLSYVAAHLQEAAPQAEQVAELVERCNAVAEQFTLVTNTAVQKAELKPQVLACLKALRGTEFKEDYASLADAPSAVQPEPTSASAAPSQH